MQVQFLARVLLLGNLRKVSGSLCVFCNMAGLYITFSSTTCSSLHLPPLLFYKLCWRHHLAFVALCNNIPNTGVSTLGQRARVPQIHLLPPDSEASWKSVGLYGGSS